MASVSTEALQQVRTAMFTFSVESEHTLETICKEASSSADACEQSLSAVIRQRDALAKTVAKERQQVQALRQEEEETLAAIRRLEELEPRLERDIATLGQQLSSLRGQLSELRSQLSEEADEQRKEQIRAAIKDTERALWECSARRDEAIRALHETRQAIAEKRSHLSRIRAQLADAEAQLQADEQQLRFLNDKCARLKSAFSCVKESTEALVSAAKRLRGDPSVSSGISCVEACINAVDEYLNVRF